MSLSANDFLEKCEGCNGKGYVNPTEGDYQDLSIPCPFNCNNGYVLSPLGLTLAELIKGRIINSDEFRDSLEYPIYGN